MVNMRFVQPLDHALLDDLIARGIPIVTVEENVLAGGFGAAVAEYCASRGANPRLTMIGLPDRFIEHADRDTLLARYGLDADSIAARVTGAVVS